MKRSTPSERGLNSLPCAPVLGTIATVPAPNRRLTRAKLLLQFAGFMALLSLSLPLVVSAQTQDLSKSQDELLSQQSGFLGDYYPKLQPDPANADLLTYWKNPDVLKDSTKFIISPVIVYLDPASQQRGIDPEQLAKLTQYFTKAIKSELESGHYTLVTEPGPGVLQLRVALSNVQPNGGKENAAVAGAAAVAGHAVAPGVSMLVPRFSVGHVSIEGELVDPVSGEVMVAFMTSKSGRRYFSGLKAYEKWGDIDAAFRAWAKNFRERLDKAHAS